MFRFGDDDPPDSAELKPARRSGLRRRSLAELRNLMAQRMHGLALEFQRAADDLFHREDAQHAMEVLTAVGRPDGVLDVMRAVVIREYLAQESLPERHARLRHLPEQLEGQALADAFVYLGGVEEAQALFAGNDENAVAVCAALLGHHECAGDRWRSLIGEPSLETLPLRYNLALSLFMQYRYTDALSEFKLCRGLYPHYRDVLFFVDWIRNVLNQPGGAPFSRIAAEMRVPQVEYRCD